MTDAFETINRKNVERCRIDWDAVPVNLLKNGVICCSIIYSVQNKLGIRGRYNGKLVPNQSVYEN